MNVKRKSSVRMHYLVKKKKKYLLIYLSINIINSLLKPFNF